MTELNVDQRKLQICEGCPAKKNIRQPAIVLLGSSCVDDEVPLQTSVSERREIATMEAHLGTYMIINTEDKPEDGTALVESVFEAVEDCSDADSISIEGAEYCPAAIRASEIFYQKIGRAN